MNRKAQLISSLKIWVVIYPALTTFMYLFGEQMSVLPIYLRTLLMTLTLVPLIVFIGVPFVNLILGKVLPEQSQNRN